MHSDKTLFMKKLKKFSSALAMLFCFLTFAQQKTITGVVSDKSGPLPGANVVVKGTTRGIQTDIDGNRFVYITKGDAASKVIIKTGKEYDGKMEVTEGLKEGDLLIYKGYDSVNEGDKISATK